MIRNLFGKLQDDLLKVTLSFQGEGLAFEVSVKDRGRLTFPLEDVPLGAQDLLRQKALPQLIILQELWMNSLIDRAGDGTYLLSYDKVDEIPEDLRKTLGIPGREGFEIFVKSHLAVGNEGFAIHVAISHPEYGRLSSHQRRGHAVQVGKDRFVLMHPEAAHLLDRVERKPQSVQEQFPYLAEVKALAEKAGARMDDYLKRENYIFPGEMDVNVQAESLEKITLIPEILGIPGSYDPSELEKGYGVAQDEEGRRHRVFLGDDMKTQLKQLQHSLPIEGTAVPEFLGNPEAFLPPDLDLDLEKFSDRVKGLGIRAYTARPYVNVTPSGANWFQVDAGIHKTSTTDGTSVGRVQGNEGAQQLLDLAEKAPPEGGWVLDGKEWVHVPKGASKFAEATEQLITLSPSGRVTLAQLGFFLEIYMNVDVLEFDAGFRRLAEELRLGPTTGEEIALPQAFNGSLYDYQLDGYAWMGRNYSIPAGGLLADEMGLGKTVQVIAFMAHLFDKGELGPSLVVCPKTLTRNWKDEIGRFLPAARTHIHEGPGRIREAEYFKMFHVVITTYETLVRDQICLGQVDWTICVCDEAQRIKNYTTSASRVCKAMKAVSRLALTGTPVENSLGDLWSIVDYVQPGLLGSYQQFRERFERPLSGGPSEEQAGNIERELMASMYLVYQRRTKEEHLTDLPPKTEIKYPVPLSPLQLGLYRDILDEMKGGLKGRGMVLQAIRRLLEVCAHPYLETGNYNYADPVDLIECCPKLASTLDILREVRDKGEKCLVFTDRRAVQDILVRVILSEFGFIPTVINGESINRLDSVKHFNQTPGFKVMVLSPRAAGTGLTITGANHVIHYTRWWNPAVENQATDRVHRIGQEKPTTIHLPICEVPGGKTVEQVLDELLTRKRKLAKSIIVPSSQLNITEKDMAAALGF